jgi:hypothetical protein
MSYPLNLKFGFFTTAAQLILCSDIHFAYSALPTSRLLTFSTSFFSVDSSRVIKEKGTENSK